ncbi:hypothetical protein AAC387_Pa12g1223 [Persea americana]
MYGLKMAVGRGLTKALSEGVVNREEIFVTSMLWGSDHHDPIGGLRQTLKTSPSEIIVPFDQYMESIKANHYIGMRVKMIFEGEEAEQSFTGTIVDIEDVDHRRWIGSKWRCLKVRWDGTSSVPLPERVSTWKIEPALTLHVRPSLSQIPTTKRPCGNVVPSPGSSVIIGEGMIHITS